MFTCACTKRFGEYIKELRVSLGLSQKDVEYLSGVSSLTLQRIESGKVLPRFETLSYLSLAYKKDLLIVLRLYTNSSVLFDYYLRLEDLIATYNIEVLQNLSADFNEFVEKNYSENSFPIDSSLQKQFSLVLEGLSKYYSNTPERSYNDFIDAIKLTNPLFNTENFNLLKYSVFEMRILFLIALSLVHKEQISQSNSLLTYLLETSNFDRMSTNVEKFLIIKLYLNLSYNYHSLDLHDKAIEYAKAGIDFCNKHHLSYALPQLFSRKGIAEFLLNQPNYLKSLEQCICLLNMTKQEELAKKYVDIMQKSYNITVPCQ